MVSSKRLEMIRGVLDKGSNDPFHHYAYAMELRTLGDVASARSAFATLRTTHPNYVAQYLMAGQIEVEAARWPEARAILQRGIEVARQAGDEHAVSEMRALLQQVEADLE